MKELHPSWLSPPRASDGPKASYDVEFERVERAIDDSTDELERLARRGNFPSDRLVDLADRLDAARSTLAALRRPAPQSAPDADVADVRHSLARWIGNDDDAVSRPSRLLDALSGAARSASS